VAAEDFALNVTRARDLAAGGDMEGRHQPGAVLADEHVATLGGQLFGLHLIAIEAAGTLLLVALVGAIAIVSHERAPRTAAYAGDGRAAKPGKGF
jgi:hypothetical protein